MRAITHFWDWRDPLVRLENGLRLQTTQLRLLERLFAGCSKVVVSSMSTSLSGCMLLHTQSYDSVGALEDPTVTKLGPDAEIRAEVKQTQQLVSPASQSIATAPGRLSSRCPAPPGCCPSSWDATAVKSW
jgi:hypothetical protein